MIWILWPIFTLWWWLGTNIRRVPEHRYCRGRSQAANVDEAPTTSHPQQKPDWVMDAVVRTAAHRPIAFRSYRKVA